MRYLILVLIIGHLLSCENLAQKQNNPGQVITGKMFEQKVKRIHDSVIDLTVQYELFNVSEFVEIYNSPEKYLKEVQKFIVNPNKSIKEKIIAINAMQKLDLVQYTELLSTAATAYNDDRLEENVLKSVISSHISEDYIVIKNFQDTTIIEILQSISIQPRTSVDLNNLIDDILSGRYWNDINSKKG